LSEKWKSRLSHLSKAERNTDAIGFESDAAEPLDIGGITLSVFDFGIVHCWGGVWIDRLQLAATIRRPTASTAAAPTAPTPTTTAAPTTTSSAPTAAPTTCNICLD
jgi:hypothetical protein